MQTSPTKKIDAKPGPTQRSPSRVLYIRKLACSVTTYLLQHIISQYGPVVRTVILRPKNEVFIRVRLAGALLRDPPALVEMENLEDAKKVYELGQHQSIVIHKSVLKISYSDHQNIEDLLNHNPVNNILLFTICTIPGSYLHIDDLVKNIEKFGKLRRIRLFKNYSIHHALVQMETIEDAQNVKEKMSKISIQVKNEIFRFDIQYSKLKDLIIYQNNSTCLNYDLITPSPHQSPVKYSNPYYMYNNTAPAVNDPYVPTQSYYAPPEPSGPSYGYHPMPMNNGYSMYSPESDYYTPDSRDSSPSRMSQLERQSDLNSESTIEAYNYPMMNYNEYNYPLYENDTIYEPYNCNVPDYSYRRSVPYDREFMMRPCTPVEQYPPYHDPYYESVHRSMDPFDYPPAPAAPAQNNMYTSYILNGVEKDANMNELEDYFISSKLFYNFDIYLVNGVYRMICIPNFSLEYANEYLKLNPFHGAPLSLTVA